MMLDKQIQLRNKPNDSSTIKISKDAADLLFVYCKFSNIKIQDFVNELIKGKLSGFKEKLNILKEASR